MLSADLIPRVDKCMGARRLRRRPNGLMSTTTRTSPPKSSPLGVATARCVYIRVGALDVHRAFAEFAISMTKCSAAGPHGVYISPHASLPCQSLPDKTRGASVLSTVYKSGAIRRAVHNFGYGGAPPMGGASEDREDDGTAW